jgi:CRP/FNR family transcriptional regulator
MNLDEKVAALAGVPLFSQIGRKDLERLATVSTERSFTKGTEIVKEGDVGIAMFIIASGEVETVKQEDGREIHLANQRRGDFFGEMALFENFPRSATVRAKSDVECLALTEWDLHAELRGTPEISMQLLKAVVRRLRETSTELAELKGEGADVSS